MFARASARQEARCGGPELFAAGARIDRSLDVEEAGENASDVRLDDRDSLVESKGGDCVGGVTANAGQLANRFQLSRKNAAVLFLNRERGGPKIPGARVIAEALPGVKDIRLRGCGDGLEVREAPHPFIVIRNDGNDLRLLEHELGNKDRVGVRGASPGKIATVFAIPG